MYHTITPVTSSHDPIIVEGNSPTQLILFNAGPSIVEAQVWTNWSGKIYGEYSKNESEPNLRLELRPGNEKIISGAFVRIKLKDDGIRKEPFAAIGTRVIPEFTNF